MAGMFFCCLLLSAADVSSWDVSRVTSCDCMFAGCRVLKPTGSFWFHLGDDCVNGNLALIPARVAIRLTDEVGFTLHNQISRRNFVAGAATVGAMAAFGMAGCSSKGSGKAESKAEEYDIVIVGAGGAGMSAAIAAHDAGVEKVVVLEKEGNVGGNTNFSSSGMNASETKFQKAQGIEDSNELFAQETLDGGHDTGNPELVHFMCDNSAGAIDWLDGLGITLDNITMTGGMSVKRCHRPTDGSAVGKTIVPGLQKAVEDRGIEIKQIAMSRSSCRPTMDRLPA